jgi:hypothetical protein
MLTTATGGILSVGSVLGVTGAPAALAASTSVATQLTSASCHPQGWDGDDWGDDGWGDGDGPDGGWLPGDPGQDSGWGDGDDYGSDRGPGGECHPEPGPGRHRGEHHPQDNPRPRDDDHRDRTHDRGDDHGRHRKDHPTPWGDPRAIAREMIPNPAQFGCFDRIIKRESNWNPHAHNRSGAYGLPQALPGRKMASAGPDWRTNPRTQIRWAIGYMDHRYGSPCGAWTHWRHHHNY